MKMKTIAALMLSLGAVSAGAQSVYRCGSEYSQSPCPQAKVIDAADGRTEAQRADGQRVAADERQLGRQMERERLALASTQTTAGAAGLGGAPAKPAERAHAKKLKWAKKARARA